MSEYRTHLSVDVPGTDGTPISVGYVTTLPQIGHTFWWDGRMYLVDSVSHTVEVKQQTIWVCVTLVKKVKS